MKRKKQDKYTKSSRGQECQIRLPGCNGNPETTVPCHLNGGGMGTKSANIHIAYGCSNCHDLVDGRTKTDLDPEYILLSHYEAVVRTQIIMLANGVLKL